MLLLEHLVVIVKYLQQPMETEPDVLSLDEFGQVLDKNKEMDDFILQEVLTDEPSTEVTGQIQTHEQSNNQVCLTLTIFLKMFFSLFRKTNKNKKYNFLFFSL